MLAGLVLAVVLTGCGKNSAPIISVPTSAQVAEFTQKAVVTLPVTAKSTGWKESRGMDDALWLKIEMPVAELNAFIEASPFQSGGFQTNWQYDLYNFQDFLPTPPLKYRTGQKALPNVKTLNMLIDDSNPTNAVVYMMWFEM